MKPIHTLALSSAVTLISFMSIAAALVADRFPNNKGARKIKHLASFIGVFALTCAFILGCIGFIWAALDGLQL